MSNQIKLHTHQLFNADECDEIILRSKELGLSRATTIDNKHFARNCSAVWLDEPGGNLDWVLQALYDFVDDANKEFGFEISELETPQFLRYRWLQRYLAHFDSAADEVSQRKLTVVVQLSHPLAYLGGNLRVWSSSPMRHAPRERGMAVAFPSFCRHQANPVWLGTRYALVSWVDGPHQLR